MRTSVILLSFLAVAQAAPAISAEYLVRDQAAYRAAAKAAKPGDEIVLADGEWRDFQILFEGIGEPLKPIVLRAQTKGGVVLSGNSNLRLSGKHLLVSGLVFRDGHALSDEVITFRRDSRRVASNSRVTEVVIDRFNKPDRRAEDIWVALYGEDNRVDHSHFEGKTNAGVTLAVIRPKGQPQANRHRIDHNYFGPRPNLGSNGGETIRIGTSEESLTDSNTIVENNYFEHTDGEVEIVSSKSGGNIFRGNVFYESQGALVLRHGSGNLVEGNFFFGNSKPHTGGVRVVNPRQTVRDNYLERLSGTGFTSAITVMNGVPNSVINRYHQVVGAVIENNTIIEPARITLAAGADAERSAPPKDTVFRRNLIVASSGSDPFRAEGDISGISFAGNVQTPVAKPLLASGFERRAVTVSRNADGLLVPDGKVDAGMTGRRVPVKREATGAAWYPKRAQTVTAFGSGSVQDIGGGDALAAAVARAPDGGVVRLAGGTYRVDAPIVVERTLTIAGASAADKPVITFTAPTLFQIEDGGRIALSNLVLSGADAPAAPGNAVLRTSARSMPTNYTVVIEESEVRGLSAPAFDVIATTPDTLADRIAIFASKFDGVSGSVLAARSETKGKGHYNAEYVEISNSEFRNVGSVAEVLRGGTDESTFGPHVTVANSLIENSGRAGEASLHLSGVQHAAIVGNRFVGSGPVRVVHSVGAPETAIVDNRFEGTALPVVEELHYKGPPRATLSGNIAGAAQ